MIGRASHSVPSGISPAGPTLPPKFPPSVHPPSMQTFPEREVYNEEPKAPKGFLPPLLRNMNIFEM